MFHFVFTLFVLTSHQKTKKTIEKEKENFFFCTHMLPISGNISWWCHLADRQKQFVYTV